MAKIDITRTQLVWPGKYDEEGNLVPPRRVSLPFQVIERVNETRATREQQVRGSGQRQPPASRRYTAEIYYRREGV
jgi:hypothetical protein